MKKILSFICVGLLFVSCATTKNNQADTSGYTLEGQLGEDAPEELYLSYQADGQRQVDTSRVTDGQFLFTGHVNNPTQAYLLKGGRQALATIYLENADMTFQKDGDEYKVTGSKTQQEYEQLQEATADISDKRSKLIGEYREAAQNENKEKMDSIREQVQALSEQETEITNDFIKTHPSSYVSLYNVQQMVMRDYDQSVKAMYDNLDEDLKDSGPGRQIEDRIAILSKTEIGKIAPDFTQKDVNGNAVSLSDFRGQYVLLDFWAAWCGPCRAENPNVVEAYHEYNDDGFTVLGVSLDRDREDWLDAIEEDNLEWTQVSDLNFWQNEAAQQYGIRAIPANFLINPEGEIIAKDLRGDALNEKLEEIFSSGS